MLINKFNDDSPEIRKKYYKLTIKINVLKIRKCELPSSEGEMASRREKKKTVNVCLYGSKI